MSEVRGLRANKALRQSMRDMGLDDVIESADREDLEEAMKENKRLSKLNVKLCDENTRLKDELDVYRAAVQYTFEAINKFEVARRNALDGGKGVQGGK